MTNTTKLTKNFVEVELMINHIYYHPTVEDGELTYTPFYPDNHFSFKCKVPNETVKNKEALEEYVRKQMFRGNNGFDLEYVNIWDDDGRWGKCRFD
jgi:hypothetical protein